ncbi:MAG: hypothetical protein ACI4O7_09480 [Aristaeellaceae bacterium]
MANGDWRNLSWKRLTPSQKGWWIAMLALLAVLLAAACLDGMGCVDIPSWAALGWVALSGLAVCKNVVGLGLYDDGPEDGSAPDDDDPD